MNLINVLSDTLSAWEKGGYEFNNQKVPLLTTLDEAETAVVLLPEQIAEICQNPLKNQFLSEPGVIRCLQMDSFSCAIKRHSELKQSNRTVKKNQIVVLNFANPIHPGGGVRRGAKAQEEDLCRRCSLLLSLESKASRPYYEYNLNCDRYLSSDAMIISPKVEIIKDENYMPLSKSLSVAVITCAAPIYSLYAMTNDTKSQDLHKQYYQIFYQRIYRLLKCCAYFGYQNLVLGAWGCGAFGNDAMIVSQLFHQALETREPIGISMKDHFSAIDFAVLGRSGLYNYNQFSRVFETNPSEKKE